MAHRDILQRHAISVAKGDLADIDRRPFVAEGDAFDPDRTLAPSRCFRISTCAEGGTTAGEFLKPIMWLIIRSTPDARPGQPRTKKRKCGIQPAHQSLLTDVFASRLLLCTIHPCKNFTMSLRGDGKPCAVCLTGDIRMGWSGRALPQPAIEAGKGHQARIGFSVHTGHRETHHQVRKVPMPGLAGLISPCFRHRQPDHG